MVWLSLCVDRWQGVSWEGGVFPGALRMCSMCWIWGRDFRKKPSTRLRGSGSDIFPELAGSSVRWPAGVCSARHRHGVPSVCTVVPLPTQPQKVLLSVGAHREVDWDEQSTWQRLELKSQKEASWYWGHRGFAWVPICLGISRICPLSHCQNLKG